MRADRCGFPVFQAWVKSAIASEGARTSRVTIFIVPPLNVTLEVCNQLLGGREYVGAFDSANVSMVAFSHLVVVTKNAFAANHIGEPILETMSRSVDGFRQPPQHEFSKS